MCPVPLFSLITISVKMYGELYYMDVKDKETKEEKCYHQ